jgi:hypothetical protein
MFENLNIETSTEHRARLADRWARLGVPGASAAKARMATPPPQAKRNLLAELRAVLGSPRTVSVVDVMGDTHELRICQPTVRVLMDAIEMAAGLEEKPSGPMAILHELAPIVAHCVRTKDSAPVAVEFVMELPMSEAMTIADEFLKVFDVPALMAKLGIGIGGPKATAAAVN